MDRLLGLISTNTSIRSSFGTNNGQFSNIDFLLDERPAYKTNILLSCFLKENRCSDGYHKIVIQKLRER
jgi:hypothetical protein